MRPEWRWLLPQCESVFLRKRFVGVCGLWYLGVTTLFHCAVSNSTCADGACRQRKVYQLSSLHERPMSRVCWLFRDFSTISRVEGGIRVGAHHRLFGI